MGKISFIFRNRKRNKAVTFKRNNPSRYKTRKLMVKDENMVLPKLIDFGLSTYSGTETIGGSPMFNSSEKLFSNGTNSISKIDSVSFGVTICIFEIDYRSVMNIADNTNYRKKKMNWKIIIMKL